MSQPVRYPSLGERLENIREHKISPKGKKYSLRQISLASDVDYGHVHRIFHGQSLPSRDILLRICKAMQCTVQEAAEIFSLTDYRTPTIDDLKEDESQAA